MRLVVTTFLSLDGVMQAPGTPDEDSSNGFRQGGWQVPYVDEAVGGLVNDWMTAADAYLLGRKTYEIFAAHWSRVPTDHEHGAIADLLNNLPKYVASTTLDKLDWKNSNLLEGDVAEAVAALKRQPGRELQVHGSGNLVRTLMRHDLVDEYRLWFNPVVLGNGQRLFEDGSTPTAMRLTETRTTPTGVVIHSYQPTGRPTYGSFALDDQ
jgi:dihydrofolate reductase